jgi:hypothetical protein
MRNVHTDGTGGQQPRFRGASRRILLMASVAAVIGVVLVLALRPSSPSPRDSKVEFTRVGQNGPVFTISVHRRQASDDEYLMRIARQLSSEQIQSGGSGQVSVMVWPDDVPVPKVPPTTEFDASMKTQIAGIFINPTRNIEHLIRFRDGATVSERDFGAKTR